MPFSVAQDDQGHARIVKFKENSPNFLQNSEQEDVREKLSIGDCILEATEEKTLYDNVKCMIPFKNINMKYSDVENCLWGAAGTSIQLPIKSSRKRYSEKAVWVTRDVINSDKLSATGKIIEFKEKNGTTTYMGWIDLSKFYFGCEKDILRILNDFKNNSVRGCVINLCDNPRGSTQAVTTLSARFFGSGPVWQALTYDNNTEIKETDWSSHPDYKPPVLTWDPKSNCFIKKNKTIFKPAYEGPVVIFVNEETASAAEIFANVLQNYQRAIIIGPQEGTFGKNVGQCAINITVPSSNGIEEVGVLGCTNGMFFDLKGESYQKGVSPHISIPLRHTPKQRLLGYQITDAEKRIPPVEFKPFTDPEIFSKSLEVLKENSALRMQGISELTKEDAHKEVCQILADYSALQAEQKDDT